VTAGYPEAAAALARAAGRRTLVLDGEIAVFDGGNPSFAQLQRRMHVGRPAPALVVAVPVTYIAFDLLWQASRSLLRSPYVQRRALLDGLALAVERLSVPPAFPGQARALADASRELGLEGVVLKRLSSSYQPGRRSGDWLKIRNLAADVLISGWLPRAGARSQLAGSVLAGAPGRTGWSTSARSAPGSPRPSAGTSPPGSWPSSSPGRRSPPPCRPTCPPGAPGAGGRGRLRRDHARGADAAPRLARPAARANTVTVP
jgi:ATP-dependent DNA ligase